MRSADEWREKIGYLVGPLPGKLVIPAGFIEAIQADARADPPTAPWPHDPALLESYIAIGRGRGLVDALRAINEIQAELEACADACDRDGDRLDWVARCAAAVRALIMGEA